VAAQRLPNISAFEAQFKALSLKVFNTLHSCIKARECLLLLKGNSGHYNGDKYFAKELRTRHHVTHSLIPAAV